MTAVTARVVRRLGSIVGALGLSLGIAYVSQLRDDIPLATLKARWGDGASRFVTVDGMEVHVRDEGSGPAVVLLHGTSSSLHTWDGWSQRLRKGHRVVRFDLPAFGLTGPSPTHDYTIDAYVAVVDHVTSRLGLRRFVIGGNSLGGGIACAYALAHPDRVRALILVDALAYPVHGSDLPLAFWMARWPVMPGLLTHLDPRRLVENGVRKSYGDISRITPDILLRYYELTLRAGNRAAFVERMRVPQRDDSARVRQLRQPTLIMWGASDRLIPVEAGRWFERDIPGARLIVYSGLGHVPMEEDPERTGADVEQFLSNLAQEDTTQENTTND
jgi:pimeloyl-ACP methyl ester carboxylesterase